MVEEIDNNALLRNDVKMLGNILGEILVFHGGKELFDQVETIREMTKSIRKEFDEDTYHKLKEKIGDLNPPMRQQVIRAFSIYFYIINIAEQNHRIRRRRQYLLEENTRQSFSIEKTNENVKKYTIAVAEVKEGNNDHSLTCIKK